VRSVNWRRGENDVQNESKPGRFLNMIPALRAKGKAEPVVASKLDSRLDSQLEESLNLVRNFEDSRQGWFWATDPDGRLTYLSESLCHLLKVDHEDLLGALFTSFFTLAEDEAHVGRSLPFLLLKRSKFEKLALRAAISAEERWWSVSGSPQFDPAGNFTGYRGSAIDVTEQRVSSESAYRLARYDSLTGLSNRLHILEVLEARLALADHAGRPCAILMIDLDRFKQINDTLGHPAGDALLNQVAERLLGIVPDRERVSRLGGDEFQIIFPDQADREALGEIAASIISQLSQPYNIGGSQCSIGASIGIAVAPTDGRTREELIRNADLALYASKANGRGRFRFFSSELLKFAEDKRLLEEDLRGALARGEIELVYQPVVDAKTDCATGVEALLRWNHPQRGVISPSTFIPIAEEADLIGPLGEWVLRQACEDAATWPGKLRVAVNVSPAQFAHASLPKTVVSALAASGLTPDRLELEITEGVLLKDSAETDAMFATLKGIGVRLALDDFGTGYSSLGYLRTAPFDKIKIDQSFIRAATLPGSRNGAIIAAIVALADALRMETTAEGVETLDQLQLVRNLGASHVQGFIYSKGLSCADVKSRLEAGDWVLPPTGPVRQRSERQAMYRTAGAICGSRYHPILIRNISESGALIEGLGEPPAGDLIVVDFGGGELAFARVCRTNGRQWGVAFDEPLMRGSDNGLRTRTRFSDYRLAQAGLPSVNQAESGQGVSQLAVTPQELADKLGLTLGPALPAPPQTGAGGFGGASAEPTVRELAVRYLDKFRHDPQQQAADDGYLRKHILPRFGHLRRDQLLESEVTEWLAAKMRESSCSEETAQRVRGILGQLGMLAKAGPGGAVARECPPGGALPLSAANLLSSEEAHALAEAIKGSQNRQLKFIVSLLILTGARQREVLHARWSDFDLEAWLWKINVARSGKKREASLPEAAIQLIGEIPPCGGSAYLLPNPATGQPFRSLARSWDTARAKAGLSDVEIDDLRFCIPDRIGFVSEMLGAAPDSAVAANAEN
jgi:diguanylate cyclase (GGDEF)-like protein/PAS domain S-box-containing protein